MRSRFERGFGADLWAVRVHTDANAAALNPYTFTITYSDNVAVAAATMANVDIEVQPPGLTAPIHAVAINTKAVGQTDAFGNAPSKSASNTHLRSRAARSKMCGEESTAS